MGESKRGVNFYGLMQAHSINRDLLFKRRKRRDLKRARYQR
ncbi:hypothetical protein UUU_11490 [Klebsiella pneumoniae subsp. pneumoniae DSM 30104 = JCM 1662 = NBRC 14940]|nr:hypothetical protein UUU_11490 [Klebsiella pneumoniae subsp. pneumoniae DSM 30104 = JCM 1662 = NBRC 14940]